MKTKYALVASLLLSAAAFAQAPQGGPAGPGGPPNPQARFEHIATELNLSDAQKPKVRQALSDEMDQLRSAMTQERESHTDPQVAHQNHQKIEQAMLDQVKPVLSAEQLTKFQNLLSAEAAARHHHPAPDSAPAAN